MASNFAKLFGRGFSFRFLVAWSALSIATSLGQPPKRVRAEPTADHPTNPAVRARLKLAGPPEKVAELDLSNADLSDADLVCLTKLPNLEKLSIAGNHVSCKGTAYLAALPKLRSLDVARTGVCLDSLLAIKSLEEFDLADIIPTAPFLRALSGLPNLHELNLGINCNVQDSTLAAIAGLSELRTLRLGFAPSVSDAGLAHLKELKQLEELDVSNAQITGSGLEILVGLPKLRRLAIGSSGITDDGIAHASGLKQLESLDLSFCKRITNAGLKHLEGLTDLRELNLYRTQIGDAGLESLKGMHHLRKLNLGRTKITSDGVETIGQLISLEELDLDGAEIARAMRVLKATPPFDNPFEGPPSPSPVIRPVSSRPAFAHLKNLVRLRKLGLARIEWYDAEGIDQLAGLPQLTELDLSEDTIRAAGQKQLLRLPHLEGLVAEPYSLDAAQFDLQNLHGLRELDMRGAWFSTLSFRPGRELPHLRRLRLTAETELDGNALGLGPLAQLPELRELELASPFLRNAGILQQAGLGQVETLVLDAPKVTDDGVKFLNGWKNLEELTLRCNLTDAGLTPIAQLTDLRKLTIAGTWITDAGLKKLVPLQNLRRLDITGTACTPAGVDALQSALPDCEIISGGRSPLAPGQFVVPDGSIE